ncbi:hypothetical protein F5882DRAFT_311794, partial [Hyaloscypha sp. PMI_1271]
SRNRLILIIIRSKSAARKLVNEKNIIIIRLISEVDTLELFIKKLGGNSGDDVTKLTIVLEFILLTII